MLFPTFLESQFPIPSRHLWHTTHRSADTKIRSKFISEERAAPSTLYRRNLPTTKRGIQCWPYATERTVSLIMRPNFEPDIIGCVTIFVSYTISTFLYYQLAYAWNFVAPDRSPLEQATGKRKIEEFGTGRLGKVFRREYCTRPGTIYMRG